MTRPTKASPEPGQPERNVTTNPIEASTSVAPMSPNQGAGAGQGRPNALRRFASATVPAALVTLGLYGAMQHLVAVDDFALEDKPQRVLTTLTPQIESSEIEIKTPPRPVRLDAETPPPPRPLEVPNTPISYTPASLVGAAPKSIGFVKIEPIATSPVTIGDRQAIPVRDPLPSYPRPMAEAGIEGTCDVRFDLDARGRPYNVVATCTHSGFEREAARAVGRAEFAPAFDRGQPVQQVGMLYPLVFKLS